MFRIGEFSKMSRTTVKALRYYDEIGILKPECIDEFTNYRLYSTNRLITLHKIKAMRQAGLSIDEIRCILDGKDGTELPENRRSLLISEIRERERMLSGLEFLISERKSFINGVWKRESEDDWLTEIQVPIEAKPDCRKR